MRFDLLDEYSTLVPFGLGVSRKPAVQNPDVPAQEPAFLAEAYERGSRPGLLHKLLGALRPRSLIHLGRLMTRSAQVD